MTAISETLSSSTIEKHLRPFDPRRDLAAVADLVELCFSDTLDPDGRDYLARMRSASSGSSLQRAAQGWANPSMGGFVWVEDGSIVGNVSLIPYLLNARRFYLIANVAVHPSFRRRGIARLLTEKAVQYARDHLSPAVWLHVREENQVALNLYESEGFTRRAVRTTWIGIPDFSPVGTPPGTHFITPESSQWRLQSDWLKRSYPAELCWHLPFRLDNLRPGFVGAAFRFLNNVNIRQWGIVQEGRLAAVAAWQAASGHANPIWLAAPEQQYGEAIRALLEYIRHHSPTRRNLALDYPAHQFEDAICAAGFSEQQTLVWMCLQLV
jgi:ribosomal protein S18 acetylase RimI-like enzyme